MRKERIDKALGYSEVVRTVGLQRHFEEKKKKVRKFILCDFDFFSVKPSHIILQARVNI